MNKADLAFLLSLVEETCGSTQPNIKTKRPNRLQLPWSLCLCDLIVVRWLSISYPKQLSTTATGPKNWKQEAGSPTSQPHQLLRLANAAQPLEMLQGCVSVRMQPVSQINPQFFKKKKSDPSSVLKVVFHETVFLVFRESELFRS